MVTQGDLFKKLDVIIDTLQKVNDSLSRLTDCLRQIAPIDNAQQITAEESKPTAKKRTTKGQTKSENPPTV